MKKIYLLFFLFFPFVVPAQFSYADGEGFSSELKMDYFLYQAVRYFERYDSLKWAQAFEPWLITQRNGKIKVSIGSKEQPVSAALLRGLGCEVMTIAGKNAKCALWPGQIRSVARALPEGWRMKAVLKDMPNNQGPAVMNSLDYITSGNGGQGIKVAIMDYGFGGYANAVGSVPPAPDNEHLFDSTGNGIDQPGDGDHGTNCVEIVYDHVPEAEFFIIQIENAPSDWESAMAWAVDKQIDIISCSLGPHNTGWDDNSGYACEAVLNAVNNNILFFVSAGNEAEKHWSGTFNDSNNDNYHDWSGDRYNNVVIPPPDPGNALNVFTVWLQWDADPSEDHYDLEVSLLFNGTFNFPAWISANTDDFESTSLANSTNNNIEVGISVRAKTNNPPPFELFISDDEGAVMQFVSAASSLESPANTTHQNVISVGAVHRVSYAAPDQSDVITHYSSRGPTHGGVLAPDLCAPTSCTTTTGSFSGTSCSAPNAAGAAAAFWAAHPYLSPDGVRQILLQKARIFRDWGAEGDDNVYGRGGLYLHEYHSNNRYVYKNSGNSTGVSALPYRTIEQANASAPSNSHIIFLGENFDAPPAGTVINTPMLYQCSGRNAETVIK